MKKTRFAALVVILASTASLSACSLGSTNISCNTPSDEAPTNLAKNVAAVIAPTSNFVFFDNAISAAASDIKSQLSADGTQFDVVLADGSPALESKNWVTFAAGDVEVDKQNSVDYAYQSLQDVSDCATIVAQGSDPSQALATQPEVDLLKALQVAADGAMADGKPLKINVLANGIQTAGQFKMQDGLPTQGEGVSSIVRNLEAQGALPNLQGAEVNWYGLGQVDGVVQKSLNQQSIDALQQFWTEVVESSGGTIGKIVRSIPQKAPASSAIKVSPILGLKDACLYTLTEGDGFQFKPDSAQFTDLGKATNGASKIVTAITKSNCTGSLVVTGYTASGMDKSKFDPISGQGVALSLTRAKAFAGLLKNLGVKLKMQTVGGGKGPANDWNPDGTFSEALGKLNRRVVIAQAGN